MFACWKKWTLMLFAIMAFARPAWAGEAVAMVTDVKGAATLSAEGSSEGLALLAYLTQGAEIRINANSRVVITYFSPAQEYAFAGPAVVRIGGDAPVALSGKGPEVRRLGPEKAGAARKFTAMQREKLAQATFEMRGARAGVRLIGPIETEVLGTMPEFEWSGPQHAERYRVTLLDGGRVLHEATTAASMWTLPASAALQRGKSYQWKVETALPSGETLSASGKFHVLDAMDAERIIAARPKADAGFSERVLYATFLEAEGLRHDAAKTWQLLAHERPDELILQDQAAR